MTIPPFKITIEPKMLRAVLRGFWDVDTAHAYGSQLRELGEQRERWLIDLSDISVQSRDVINMLSDLSHRARPPIVALVEKSALAAIQSKRVTAGRQPRTFASAALAEEWLLQQSLTDVRD